MNNVKLISRIAADKSNKRIGRIIRIDNLPVEGSKNLAPHLIILVKKFLKKDHLIPIEVSKITKTEDNYVWLDITTEEFEEILKSAKDYKDYSESNLPSKDYTDAHKPSSHLRR